MLVFFLDWYPRTMPKKLHVIYIPGIGDHKLGRQRMAVDMWKHYGVEPEICALIWNDGQSWESKFERLLNRIDELVMEGKSVGIVGVSAGATAAINAFAVRKEVLVGIVCVAGKIHRPQTVGGLYKQQNPAFITSAYACQDTLRTLSKDDLCRIQSRYGLFDNIVLTRDSHINGAHNKRVFMILHIPIIATQIYLGAPSILKFLKRQAK